jgi:hypothetical protein
MGENNNDIQVCRGFFAPGFDFIVRSSIFGEIFASYVNVQALDEARPGKIFIQVTGKHFHLNFNDMIQQCEVIGRNSLNELLFIERYCSRYMLLRLSKMLFPTLYAQMVMMIFRGVLEKGLWSLVT